MSALVRSLGVAAKRLVCRSRAAETRAYQRLSAVLLLEALIASPAAVQNALQMLRALLLEEDPEVARLRAALEGRNTPPPA